ncbi:NAD(P)-dependent oxidoreductase [Mucilaginibacter flavus]|uniref:NAD(P)-dependent oxidoreductase n=1 Tax=Mucilaginibacter flavus TaxID=931504 RepID=UPI0025B38B74|nr:NAD(P)-dependent oxidoreductase [Mucilaginibacter flavus]MDN3580395.1 NAD(P)-dependent oxidoreductase [Mucilaginibacter flavus]
MKVALIGATGFVGTAVLNEALSRGYEVTAIARDTKKITAISDKLIAVAADVYDADILAEVLKGHDAVVNTFNAGWGNPDLYNDFIKGSEAIQKATKQAGVKRLLVVGGAGSLYITPELQLVDSPQFPAEWKTGATAARDYLNIIKKEEDLDWTFLSPAINLHPGTRTGKFRLGTDEPVFDADGKAEISVEDMAVAIINELENNQFVKRRFTLGY